MIKNKISFHNIMCRFEVVLKTSENINPRKEGVVFLRESVSVLVVECFSSFLMFSGTDLYSLLYDLKAARNNTFLKKKEMFHIWDDETKNLSPKTVQTSIN
jgi:hypothetical protein